MKQMRPSDERLREAFDTLEPYIERRYGVPVIINDVPDPFTGDLDGSEIHVDYANELETAVFIIAHLFGHTVQWNLSEYARHIGEGGCRTLQTRSWQSWRRTNVRPAPTAFNCSMTQACTTLINGSQTLRPAIG